CWSSSLQVAHRARHSSASAASTTLRARSPARRNASVQVFLRDLHDFRAAPEPLQAIERARIRRENMHDEIEVVEEHPLRALEPSAVRRTPVLLARRALDRLDDRLSLPRRLPRADDERIRERLAAAQVHHGGLLRLLVERRAKRRRDRSGELRRTM